MTRKVEIRLRCSSSTSVLISGYIIGSPTRDKAQCLGERPSVNRSNVTPTGGEFPCQKTQIVIFLLKGLKGEKKNYQELLSFA